MAIDLKHTSETCLFVWTEAISATREGGMTMSARVKHVAIQVGERYLSFQANDCNTAFCQAKGKHCHIHFEQDKAKYDARIEFRRFAISHLCSPAMQETIKYLREALTKEKWGALGWGFPDRAYERTAAGVIAYVLKRGGIHKLISKPQNGYVAYGSHVGLSLFITTALELWDVSRVIRSLQATQTQDEALSLPLSETRSLRRKLIIMAISSLAIFLMSRIASNGKDNLRLRTAIYYPLQSMDVVGLVQEIKLKDDRLRAYILNKILYPVGVYATYIVPLLPFLARRFAMLQPVARKFDEWGEDFIKPEISHDREVLQGFWKWLKS